MRIKDISIDNRPRERFLRQGGGALSDAELLAVILQKGSKGENVIDAEKHAVSGIAVPAICLIDYLKKA